MAAEFWIWRNCVYGGWTMSYRQIFNYTDSQHLQPWYCSRVNCTKLQATLEFHRGEGKHPTLAHSSHIPLPKRGRKINWKILLWFTVQSHRLTRRLRLDHETVECVPSPYTSPPCEAHLKQFLSYDTTRLEIKKKWQAITRQKTQSEERQKHQNQT